MRRPYAYLGWGSPPDPRTIMTATGVKWFTMAFILSNGACNPLWDGNRPLTGGNDQTTINNIRGAGGNVAVSFGGATGPWLEQTCSSASALAAAYQKVINAYGLKAIDIDIEGTVYNNPTLQQRTIDALKTVQGQQPGPRRLRDVPERPDRPGLHDDQPGGASGLTVDGWTIMPFDFGARRPEHGQRSPIQAAEGLKNTLKNGYGYTDDQAYRHAGISSMNGITDVNETVTQADFRTMLAYAQQHHLARLHVLVGQPGPAVHRRHRSPTRAAASRQQAWDFTRIIAQYQG